MGDHFEHVGYRYRPGSTHFWRKVDPDDYESDEAYHDEMEHLADRGWQVERLYRRCEDDDYYLVHDPGLFRRLLCRLRSGHNWYRGTFDSVLAGRWCDRCDAMEADVSVLPITLTLPLGDDSTLADPATERERDDGSA